MLIYSFLLLQIQNILVITIRLHKFLIFRNYVKESFVKIIVHLQKAIPRQRNINIISNDKTKIVQIDNIPDYLIQKQSYYYQAPNLLMEQVVYLSQIGKQINNFQFYPTFWLEKFQCESCLGVTKQILLIKKFWRILEQSILDSSQLIILEKYKNFFLKY
ncbi:unnamed protein product [Paramecium sonneborni]|uniref:Uncharacterized protein n=1 Tax=Paramecium sonneborni TaxID=65129 RepID=A0A8S1N7X0_9CILI|nr:unnamed protein product [Paramecium sonneborni]